ncbi:hypothetical protein [Candidatus Caldatribacterium sp.]|uniref:class II glutamine amidotransferase n=1 Tax=Candidatus Caldatribacterium sp. TaxID=2282143 RepID=UPI003846D533|nr:class II glutamine amidotransferase [Candidatus Caldatribacterium sp.]
MCRLAIGNREATKLELAYIFRKLELSLGGHGNGIAMLKNNAVTIVKGTSLTTDEAARIIKDEEPEWFIFHTRLASCGKVADENCHPFHVGNIVAAMNGTEPWLRSIAEELGITDTEAFLLLIKEFKLDPFKMFKRSPSDWVGFIKVGGRWEPFISVGSLFCFYRKGQTIFLASELPHDVAEVVLSGQFTGFVKDIPWERLVPHRNVPTTKSKEFHWERRRSNEDSMVEPS